MHAVGSVNYLFDSSFEPYMSASEISKYFEANTSTVSQKATVIKKALKMSRLFDDEFSTEQMIETNPLNNMVMVDGYIVPLSSLPENVQEMVRQARAEGKDISFTPGEE